MIGQWWPDKLGQVWRVAGVAIELLPSELLLPALIARGLCPDGAVKWQNLEPLIVATLSLIARGLYHRDEGKWQNLEPLIVAKIVIRASLGMG